MPLIPMPRELIGAKFIYNPVNMEWELPKNATEEQKKALEEYDVKIEKALRDSCIIED